MSMSVIQRVETFIQRLHDADIVIMPEALKITYQFPATDAYSAMYPVKRSLSDCLANAVSQYEEHRNDVLNIFYYADACLEWINRAITTGVIKEGKGLFSKTRNCEDKTRRLIEENRQLKEENDKLQKECRRLNELNEALHNTLDKFGSRNGLGNADGNIEE
jgi:hypothetical protein